MYSLVADTKGIEMFYRNLDCWLNLNQSEEYF